MDGELLADQPLGQKLIKKGFWLYLFAYLGAPAGYITKVLISNSVSVADVGVLYSIVGLITFLNIYNDLGLTESLQYFLPRYWIKKQYNYIKTSIYLSFFAQFSTALLIAFLLRIGAPWLAQHYFHSPQAVIILKYFCWYFLGINLFQILQSIFVAFQHTFAFQFIEFVRTRSIVGFTTLFFFTGKQSIEWYTLNRILGLGIGIIIGLFFFYKYYKRLLLQGTRVRDRPMLKEYFNYALRAFIGLNVAQLFGQIIQQLLIILLGPESAGYYSNFISLFGITGVLLGPIMGLIFPLVSELVTKKDTNKLNELLRFFYTYLGTISFLVGGFLAILGPEIATIFFGEKFYMSGLLLQRGGWLVVLTNLVGFNFSVLAGLGKVKERVKILLWSTIITLISTIGGIYGTGIYGAIIGLSAGYLTLFFMSLHLMKKDIPLTLDWRLVGKNVLLLIVVGSILWMNKKMIFVIDDTERYKNLLMLLIIAGGYVLIMMITNWRKLMILKKEVIRLTKR